MECLDVLSLQNQCFSEQIETTKTKPGAIHSDQPLCSVSEAAISRRNCLEKEEGWLLISMAGEISLRFLSIRDMSGGIPNFQKRKKKSATTLWILPNFFPPFSREFSGSTGQLPLPSSPQRVQPLVAGRQELLSRPCRLRFDHGPGFTLEPLALAQPDLHLPGGFHGRKHGEKWQFFFG